MLPIEEIIENTLNEIGKITNESEKNKYSNQKSKLIFPKYFNGNHKETFRVSEQELRLLFIRQLENLNDYSEKFYYSIETPTKKLYNFSEDKTSPLIINKDYEVNLNGQSASFDLTLYNHQFERSNFIEFKNENVDTVKKDFLKLLCDEENMDNYLVHIIYRKSNKEYSIESIKNKYKESINYIIDNNNFQIRSKLNIVLFILKEKEKKTIWFEEISSNSTNINVKKITPP